MRDFSGSSRPPLQRDRLAGSLAPLILLFLSAEGVSANENPLFTPTPVQLALSDPELFQHVAGGVAVL